MLREKSCREPPCADRYQEPLVGIPPATPGKVSRNHHTYSGGAAGCRLQASKSGIHQLGATAS